MVLVLPTFLMKRAYNEDVDERLADMWRVHKNRVDRGLGGTYKEHGVHESLLQGKEISVPNFHWGADELWEGFMSDSYLENPFWRWHESFEKYPS